MSEFVLPTGTVTLLMADIEGSVKLWETKRAEMASAMERHDTLVAEIVESHGGVRPRDQGEGDSFVAAFARPSEALSCALALQLAMAKEDWRGADIRLRVALHTGEIELRDESNYLGTTINRCARLRSLAHGGQTLMSASTYDLIADRLPEGATAKSLGSHRLKDLSRPEQVFQLNHPDLPDTYPPLKSLETLPNNLPVQLTSFVGREAEITEVRGLLGENRMLTLTGSGGCGKTRLALQVAADLIEEYEGGVWLIDLAPVGDPSVVPTAAATAMKLTEEKDREPLDTLIAGLQSRRALIILDNCEHLVAECAALANAVLHSCPSVTIIATSREPLGVDGETTWRVPSLSLPDQSGPMLVDALTQFEAVRLFIDRATKVRHNFRITNENAPAVAQICHRLDGIPLAIELAAARVRVLSPEQISEGLADRFHLLTGGTRTSMPRQQTLQASVEWSYALLSDKERLLLQRLSVFAGGFTLDAAEGVTSDGGSGGQHEVRTPGEMVVQPEGLDPAHEVNKSGLDPAHGVSKNGIDKAEVLDLLTQLVDKSLVLVDDVTGSSLRYHLLETIRQYSTERLVEAGAMEEIRTRHMNYIHEFVQSFQSPTDAAELARARRELSLEVDNFRAVARWAMTNAEPEKKLRLTAAASEVLTVCGHWREALALLDDGLAASEGAGPLARSRALSTKGFIMGWLDPSSLYAVGREALELADEAGDSTAAAVARRVMARGALALGDADKTESLDQQMSEAVAAGSEEEWVPMTYRAYALVMRGAFAEAADQFGTIAELARAAPSRYWPRALILQGNCLLLLGAFEQAREITLKGVQVLSPSEETGPSTSWTLAWVALLRGDFDGARGYFMKQLDLGRATERVGLEGEALFQLGYLEALSGNAADAQKKIQDGAELIDSVDGWRKATFATGSALYGDAFRAAGDPTRGRDRLDYIRKHNPSKVASVVAMLNESKIDRDEGRIEEAEALAFEALASLKEFGSPIWLVDALELLAGLAAGQEGYEEAARLLAAAQSERDRIGYRRFPVEQPRYESVVDKTRQALWDRFDEVWNAGGAMSIDKAVDYAMRGRGARGRTASGWSSLTPQELRVAGLVAEGLKNKAIAERLFVSPLTIETHLKHIFRKLGFKSRAELAAEAARRT